MKTLLLAAALAMPLRAATSRLAGSWLKDGQPYAVLKADGTGSIEGEAVTWMDDGRFVAVFNAAGESERSPYVLKGDVLTVTKDYGPLKLTRAGRSAKGAAKAEKAPAGKDQLSRLLVSSAWCYFRYNQVSGSSHQERVVFRADGTWGSGSRGESYSSGAYGSVAGQTDGGSGGRWKASGGRLLMSEGGAPLQDAGLEVSRNSNGYPILKSDGKEYSSCD